MIEGQLCVVSGSKIDEKTKILNLDWTRTIGIGIGSRQNVEPKFKKDFSTNRIISRTPLTPDPWESCR